MRRHLPVLIAIAAVATLAACSSDSTATTDTLTELTALLTPTGGTIEEFVAYMKRDLAQSAELVKIANLRLD